MRRILIVFSALVVCVGASTVGLVASVPTATAAVDPVVAAAGDIACAPPATKTARQCHDRQTAALLLPGGPVADASAVLPIGDEQYECGQYDAFIDPTGGYQRSWGQPLIKDKSRPVVGDNEYAGSGCSTQGAEGYYTYFGNQASPQEPGCTINCKGYYSYDVGSWHVVALNSECTQPGVGGCSASSAQVKWLNADLQAHGNTCTLAYFHRPYFSDKGGTVAKVKQLFTALYNGGVDVLLVGHQHIYERFAPMTPTGVAPANEVGVRQFIVGTGGKSTTALASPPPPNSEARNTGTFGVLKLTLHLDSYDFEFVPEAGKTFTDSDTNQACH
jgi:hypothetical protein